MLLIEGRIYQSQALLAQILVPNLFQHTLFFPLNVLVKADSFPGLFKYYSINQLVKYIV